jgi:hypothetical protein
LLGWAGGRAIYQQQVFAYEDQFMLLVEDFAAFDDDSLIWPFGYAAFLCHCDHNSNSVADKHRPDEAQPIVSIGHGVWIHGTCCEPDGHAEGQRSMSHALAKWLGSAPLLIHVMRVEVTGLTGVKHDVGLGDGAAGRVSACAYCVLFEIYRACHFPSYWRRSGSSVSLRTFHKATPQYYSGKFVSLAKLMR